MNLIQGKLVDHLSIQDYLPQLKEQIEETLQKKPLFPQVVIKACEAMARSVSDETIYGILQDIGLEGSAARAQVQQLRRSVGRDYLEQRLLIELGEGYGSAVTRTPLDRQEAVREQLYPLGVLLHIAAGNMDGLPVYSVVEGLLAGNINLLKLPSVDGGLTVMLLQSLCEAAPELSEYIYVFELSSTETASIHGLMDLSDAVVVWGGDEAVTAIRRMAPPNTRLIEWGHKLSFAYVTKAGMDKESLNGLAHHICQTNQLLCSSCQGVFLDTANRGEALAFCHTFLPILEGVAQEYPDVPLAARAQNTLELETRQLEGIYGAPSQVCKGRGVSLILEAENDLTISLQFRNVWVKCLEQARIVSHLHPHKNHLQTAALLCGEGEREALCQLLWRTGVVRITDGEGMSHGYCGAAHDGEHPLRRYTKIVSAE